MSEWWTYTLSDFLMFSSRTYYRMLERHNEAVWPAQILALGAGLAILLLLRRDTAPRGRIIAVVLAALWAWTSWSFLWERYGVINRAAAIAAPAFALEASALVWVGAVRDRLHFTVGRDPAALLSLTMLVGALVLYPLLPTLFGRPWRQAEVFGLAPDPTTVATVGLLLLARCRHRWMLLVVPLLWCAVSAATLYALGAAEAVVPAAAAVVAVGAPWLPPRPRGADRTSATDAG